jgi:hypothetical protein
MKFSKRASTWSWAVLSSGKHFSKWDQEKDLQGNIKRRSSLRKLL